MNKHNSVTSTYYLLLKNKKREYVEELKKQGKLINDVVTNEKQQLMYLLKGFGKDESKSKPKAKNYDKTAQKVQPVSDKKEKLQRSPEKNKDNDTMANKFNKAALKPISIPDDCIDSVNEEIKNKTTDMREILKANRDAINVSKGKLAQNHETIYFYKILTIDFRI